MNDRRKDSAKDKREVFWKYLASLIPKDQREEWCKLPELLNYLAELGRQVGLRSFFLNAKRIPIDKWDIDLFVVENRERVLYKTTLDSDFLNSTPAVPEVLELMKLIIQTGSLKVVECMEHLNLSKLFVNAPDIDVRWHAILLVHWKANEEGGISHDELICPQCFIEFDPVDVLYVAKHPALQCDLFLGPNHYLRFKPNRWEGGKPLDGKGEICDELAYPECHMILPGWIFRNN